jgi:hypothetical protein
MYSSAMAPSRHLATVTMRPPPSNSPMTQVQSPDPNAIGWLVICGGVSPAGSDICLHGSYVLFNAMSRFLALPVYQDVVSVMVCKNAMPIGVIPADKVEIVHSFQVLLDLIFLHDDRSSSAEESHKSQA